MTAPEGKERERHFRCPHCNKEIVVHVQTLVKQVTVPIAENDPDHPWKFNATASQVALIEDARSSGIIAAFREAAKDMNPDGNIPRIIEKAFLSFMTHASQFGLPNDAMAPLRQQYPTANKIEIWHASGIAAISVDGAVQRFAPMRFLQAQRVQQTKQGGAAIRVDPKRQAADSWMKTRWGYVAGRGLLFEEMQKRNLGEWGRQGT